MITKVDLKRVCVSLGVCLVCVVQMVSGTETFLLHFIILMGDHYFFLSPHTHKLTNSSDMFILTLATLFVRYTDMTYTQNLQIQCIFQPQILPILTKKPKKTRD